MTNEVTRTAPKRECDHFRDCMSAREVRRIVDERDEAMKANSMLLKSASDMEEERDAARSLLRRVESSIREGRLDHDWLLVSNAECEIDAFLKGEK